MLDPERYFAPMAHERVAGRAEELANAARAHGSVDEEVLECGCIVYRPSWVPIAGASKQ